MKYALFSLILTILCPVFSLADSNQIKIEYMIELRNIVENYKGDLNDLENSAKMLDSIISKGMPDKTIEEATVNLRHIKPKIRNASHGQKLNREDQYNKIFNMRGISAHTKNILLAFNRPLISCYRIEVAASVSALIIAGVGAKVEAGYCLGDNGRQWAEIAVGPSASLGFGIEGNINTGVIQRQDYYKRTPVDVSTDESYVIAHIIGRSYSSDQLELKDTPDGYNYDKFSDFLSTRARAVAAMNGRVSTGGTAIGLAEIHKANLNFHIKLIPLGTNSEAIVDLLEFGELPKHIKDYDLNIF